MATSPDSNSHSNGSSSLGTESVSSLHRGGAVVDDFVLACR